MPFEVTFSVKPEFTRILELSDIAERLFPLLEERWGAPVKSFNGDRQIWHVFKAARGGLIVKFDYGVGAGAFRIGLAAFRRRWFFFRGITHTPELEELHRFVCETLASWVGPGMTWDLVQEGRRRPAPRLN